MVQKLHRASCLALFILALPLRTVAQGPTPPSEHLKLVVILSRHGVRSPTWTPERLNAVSALPWPAWHAAPGELTPHGYELLKKLGSFERTTLSAEGLFPATGCGGAPWTTIYADTDQRTLASGHALAEGLFPGCAPAVHSLPEGQNDPLFHADTSALPAAQADAAFAEVKQRIAAKAVTLDPTLIPQLQNVLLNCAPDATACTPTHPPAVLLSTDPLAAARGKGDHLIDLRGPLPNASTLSEDLLLEYTDGMPAADVGWGHVDEAQLRRFLAIHTAYFDLLHRTPALARIENGELLRRIAETLQQGVEGRAVDGAVGAPGQKLVVLVGHDTNLAGLAELLGLHWTLDSRTDDTPPDTELAFQLWQTSSGYVVRTVVTSQTLPQMREGQTLSAKNPPASQPVQPAGCPETGHGCSWQAFFRLLPDAGH